MEEVTNNFNGKPVFRNQPILCPWVTCQPYPSSHIVKNKFSEFVKKHGSALNNNSSKKSASIDPSSFSPYSSPPQHSSSTHFFYFLRLMQLFPDTHPATLHTVLTLSKNNFFFAIDKLLYAQKCKNDLSRKLSSLNGRGRGYVSNSRGRQVYPRSNQRYQPIPRTVAGDLAEVQRIIDLAEKPYMGVQSLENPNGVPPNEDQQMTNRVVKICVNDSEQLVHGNQAFVDPSNHEVIEIVCFDNEQTVLKQNKDDDAMEIETFNENVENIEPSIGGGNMTVSKIMEGDVEPPVIVVDTVQENGEEDSLSEGHLVEPNQFNQVNTADLAKHPITEETEVSEDNKTNLKLLQLHD